MLDHYLSSYKLNATCSKLLHKNISVFICQFSMVKNNITTIFLQCDPIDINIYIYICINTTKIIANNKII